MPEPLLPVAISARSSSEEDKLVQGLARLQAEDPTVRVEVNPATEQLLMWTMGEQQLEVLLDRLRTRAGIEVLVQPVRVAVRETVRSAAHGLGRHVKQSGGHGQYAVAQIEIEPLPQGGGFEFVDRVVGGAVPRQFIPSVEKGVRNQLERGINGHPMVDLRVTLVGGKAHSVDSSDAAFQMAGSLALREASHSAGVQLLEPLDSVTITVDDEFVGAVLADLASRRGRVRGTEPVATGRSSVLAEVPEVELTRYAVDLRALAHGTGQLQPRIPAPCTGPRTCPGSADRRIRAEPEPCRDSADCSRTRTNGRSTSTGAGDASTLAGTRRATAPTPAVLRARKGLAWVVCGTYPPGPEKRLRHPRPLPTTPRRPPTPGLWTTCWPATGPSRGPQPCDWPNEPRTCSGCGSRRRRPGLDVSGLGGVLSIDIDGLTADVGGMCTYEDLVAATLPHGLAPLVVPQLKTITVGGATTGGGIESSSFRSGLVFDDIVELDVLTGAGEIITATPDNEHADLYFGFANSYGTLGYATRLRVRLERIKPFVALRHLRFSRLADLEAAIAPIVADQAARRCRGRLSRRRRLQPAPKVT